MQEKEVKELIEEIYAEKLKELSKNSERSPGEGFFRASATGFCFRKNYYSSTSTEPTNPVTEKTQRIFRLGNLIHLDLQDSLDSYLNKEN